MTSQLRISPTASTVLDDIRHVSSSSSTSSSYIGPLSYPASKAQASTSRRKMSFNEEENDREWYRKRLSVSFCIVFLFRDITVFSIRCVVAEVSKRACIGAIFTIMSDGNYAEKKWMQREGVGETTVSR